MACNLNQDVGEGVEDRRQASKGTPKPPPPPTVSSSLTCPNTEETEVNRVPHLEDPPWKLCLGPVCTCPEVSSVPWRLRTRPRRWGRTAAARRGWRQNLPSDSEKRGHSRSRGQNSTGDQRQSLEGVWLVGFPCPFPQRRLVGCRLSDRNTCLACIREPAPK